MAQIRMLPVDSGVHVPTIFGAKVIVTLSLSFRVPKYIPPEYPDRKLVRAVCLNLKKAYGTPRLGNPTDPVDDLIYITVSNKTSPKTAVATYSALKKAYPTWDLVLLSKPSKLVKLLRPAGLAEVKGTQIRAALKKLSADFGKVTMEPLRTRVPVETLGYLRSLSGVSDKVARCVMMYTMGAKVLPVDAHVHRIAKRLGWTRRNRADQCHDELEAIVPPSLRFAFHVDCIAHGRQVCRPENPDCSRCCVNSYCEYYHSSSQD